MVRTGRVVQGRTLSAYIAEMCGRFTRNYTWEQIHALYRLTAPTAIPNLQPRFNACPTDPADTIVEHEGKRKLVEMRWGLRTVLVEQAAQGVASCELQCPRRDRDDEAVLP